jgi:hypothetical protein
MGTSNSPFGGMNSRYGDIGDLSGGNFGYKKSFKGIAYVLSK